MTEWESVRLGDVARVVSGTTPHSDDPNNWAGDVVWITPVDLGRLEDVTITSSARLITDHARIRFGLVLIPPGSVVMSSRAPIGYLGMAGTWLCTNQGCKSFVPGPLIDGRFLYFMLRHRMSDIKVLGAGATFAEVSKANVEQFEIRLPALEEQRRIASQLTSQFSTLDRARVAIRDIARSSSELQRRAIDSVFERLAAKPGRPLGSVLSLRSDVVHPYDHPTGTAEFVGLEHVESHTGRRIGRLAIEMESLSGRKPRFKRGDVVYGYLRPYLNKVWIAEFDGLCSVDQYVFKVKPDEADAEFVAAYMRSGSYLAAAPTEAGPGQLPRIRLDEVLRTPLPVVPLSEQRVIAAEVRSRLTAVGEAARSIDAQRTAIELLPSALLRGAFGHEDAA